MATLGNVTVEIAANVEKLTRGVDTAASKLSGFGRTAERMSGTVTKALAFTGAVAGVAVLGRSLSAFASSSITAYSDAEAVWNRLSGTLQTVGVDFRNVEGDIARAARAMQDITTVGDEDFAGILQRLVSVSGNYAASLRDVQTVADLAAGTQMDLNAAATLVGKAMVGETATLARYGIIVQEGADAMQLLRDKFAGMAENEAQTMQGAIKQVNNEWGDFKEAIGGALAGAVDGSSVFTRLIETLKTMTKWVEENGAQLRKLGNTFVTVGAFIGRQIGYMVEGFATFQTATQRMTAGSSRFLGMLSVAVRNMAADILNGLADAARGFADFTNQLSGGRSWSNP